MPLLVGDLGRCKAGSDLLLALLARHGVCLQPINYPTVPRGTERLPLTPSPLHDDELVDRLLDALTDTWRTLEIRRAA